MQINRVTPVEVAQPGMLDMARIINENCHKKALFLVTVWTIELREGAYNAS